MRIDETIDQAFAPIADFSASIVFYGVPFMGQDVKLILIWLVAAALFFTVYLGFINIRYFCHALDVVRGKYDDPDSDGQINRFQALATSLSGTVGLGNIAGVALAVSVGGPGAVLWMMLMGVFGMSTKFVEVMLGVKYRHHANDEKKESISGGPMYYLRDIFDNRNIPYVGHILGAVFAVCCIGGAIGGGNMFQANQSFMQLVNITGGETGWMADKGWLYGIILAALVGLVILGGIKSIAKVTSKLVPVMGGIYIVAGLFVILMNFANIPAALVEIFTNAFTPEAGIGGFVGGLLVGVQRAAFSNEAGLGSAAIVHSAVKTDQPVSQGFVGMLGPFIDTIVICMVTALIIVFSGAHHGSEGVEGVQLTSRAFETAIPGARYVLGLTVFMFAYSTLLTWSYYGQKCAAYLLGEKALVELAFKIIFMIFIVIGASSQLTSIINFTDAMILSMAIPNIIGLYFAAPEIKRDLKKYIEEVINKGKTSE